MIFQMKRKVDICIRCFSALGIFLGRDMRQVPNACHYRLLVQRDILLQDDYPSVQLL